MTSTTGHNTKKPIVIKKYANRRLYDTHQSAYITFDNLRQMIRDDQEFVIQDAKTNEDITGIVLTQILVEEESKGESVLPINFLRQVINLYGNNPMSRAAGQYLDVAMQSFFDNQERWQHYVHEAFGNFFPFGNALEDMSKQNRKAFSDAMKAFSPFPESTASHHASHQESAELQMLKQQMAEMQKKIDQLGKTGKK